MHLVSSSGWAIAIYAAVAVVLLVVVTFRLDELLVRRKAGKGLHMVEGRHFQHPAGRLMDPHGGGSAKGAARAEGKSRPRPRVIP